jgi:hypothetical protein
LKGGKKDIAPAKATPAPAKKGGLAAVAAKASAKKAAPAKPAETPDAPATEDREVDISKMSGAELDALVKSEGIKVPDEWATMKPAGKKKWLESNLGGGEAPAEPAKPAKAKREPKPEKAVVKYKTPAVEKVKTKIAPEKAAKALSGELITGADEFATIINYVENLTEDAARKLAGSLAEGTGFAEFKLGGILSRIQEEGWYKPYASFREYVEGEHGLKYRSAAYAVQIYNDLAKLNIAYDRVKEVQWTKLRTISGTLNQDNIEKMVALAKKQTVVQLMETVKNIKNKDKKLTGPSDPTKTKVITFKVHGDQDKTIAAALDKAKEAGGTTVATVALEYICLDFLGSSHTSLVEQLKHVGLDKAIEAINSAFPDVELALSMPEGAEAAKAA